MVELSNNVSIVEYYYIPGSENVTKMYFSGTNCESLASLTIFLVAIWTFTMSSPMEPVTSMTKVSDVFTISSLERMPKISRKTSGPISSRSPRSKFFYKRISQLT